MQGFQIFFLGKFLFGEAILAAQGVSITPHKWVPIIPITPLFERANL